MTPSLYHGALLAGGGASPRLPAAAFSVFSASALGAIAPSTTCVGGGGAPAMASLRSGGRFMSVFMAVQSDTSCVYPFLEPANCLSREPRATCEKNGKRGGMAFAIPPG